MSEERAADGVDHLQRAALEMIAATRAFLDVAEEVVADRDKVAEVVTLVSDVAGSAAAGARRARAERPGARDDDDPGGDRVEHIHVG